MSSQSNVVARLTSYFGGVLAVFLLVSSSIAQAQQVPTLSCGSTEATLGQNFDLTPDQPISLVCSLTNTSAESVSVMLLGKMFVPGQSLPNGTSADATLEGNETAQVQLSFGPVFRNGDYIFTFVPLDTATGQPIGSEVKVIGTLGSADGKQVRIMAATLDKGVYQWGEAFILALALDVPEGKSAADVTATVVMQDKDGKSCSTLLEKRVLTKTEEDLSLVFPKEAGQCVNALGLTLQSKDGKIVDKKILAVGLTYGEAAPTSDMEPGVVTEESGSGLSVLMIGALVFVVVFLLVLVGYAMTHRKRSVV